MLMPKRISKKPIFGVVSTSYPYALELPVRYERALNSLKSLGFSYKEGKYLKTKTGFTAGTAKQRAEDINNMFADPQVEAILCVNGGSMSSEVLEFIDYEIIKKNPKPFVGYSDVTSILSGINAKTGLITFHGPMLIPQFGEVPQILDFSFKSFNQVLRGINEFELRSSKEWTDEFLDGKKGEDVRPRKTKINDTYQIIRKGEAKGNIIVGNLRILCSLLGTPYFPSMDNIILFLEDLNLNTAEFKRNMIHLHHAGIMKKVKAVVVGRLLMCKEKDGISVEQILKEVVKEGPIIIGADFGHTDPMLTIPFGAKCRINSAGQIIVSDFNVQ